MDDSSKPLLKTRAFVPVKTRTQSDIAYCKVFFREEGGPVAFVASAKKYLDSRGNGKSVKLTKDVLLMHGPNRKMTVKVLATNDAGKHYATIQSVNMVARNVTSNKYHIERHKALYVYPSIRNAKEGPGKLETNVGFTHNGTKLALRFITISVHNNSSN